MKVETKPTRSGNGLAVKVDGRAVAWIDAHGNATVGRKYRAELGDKPVPDDVRAAIDKARARAKRAAGKAA